MLAGLAELAWFVCRPAQHHAGQIAAYLTGILVAMAGLVIAGPWLTMVGAAPGAAHPAARPLIAGRRLADNPQAGFRAVSGLVLALFVTSVAIGVITTIEAHDNPPSTGAAKATLVQELTTFGDRGPNPAPAASIAGPLSARLRTIPGVAAVAVVHEGSSSPVPDHPDGVVLCSDLAAAPTVRPLPGRRHLRHDPRLRPIIPTGA